MRSLNKKHVVACLATALGLLLAGVGLWVWHIYTVPGLYGNHGVAHWLHRSRTQALRFDGPYLELDHFEYFGAESLLRYRAFYRLKQSGVSFANQLYKDYPNQEWDGFGGSRSIGGEGFKLSMRSTSKPVEISLIYDVHPFRKTPEFVVVEDELRPPAPSSP